MSMGYILLNIDKDGTPSTKLGPKMGMESRSLTRSLKMMEKEGLIERRQDENDRRIMLVYLTHRGRLFRETARETVLQFNDFIREQLSEKELDAFLATLKKLNRVIDHHAIFDDKVGENGVPAAQHLNTPNKNH